MKSSSLERRHKKTDKEDLKYEKQLNKLEREIRRLRNEVKTLNEALAKSDEYIISMVKEKTVQEIVDQVKSNDVQIDQQCPNCKADEMRKIDTGTVVIIACSKCPYRNRLHAGRKQA